MAERLLNDEISRQIQTVFDQLTEPVEVLFFGKKTDCTYCDDTRQLVEEVVGLSDKISLVTYDLDEDAEMARQYRVDKAPGLMIAGRHGDQILDYGIRFAGIPSGHEFSAFIHDIVFVSGGDSGLSPATREYLKGLNQPVLLQVFTTPT
jgi:alkyl hydroperoxide reductase subunit AhpF